MPRPLVLVHGYLADDKAFHPAEWEVSVLQVRSGSFGCHRPGALSLLVIAGEAACGSQLSRITLPLSHP
jgi:hypothetical protein